MSFLWNKISPILALSFVVSQYLQRGKQFTVVEIPPIQNNDGAKSICQNISIKNETYCQFENTSSLFNITDDNQIAITQHIRNLYFTRVRQKCNRKFVFYSCDPAKIDKAPGMFKGCCGFGDRLRGVVASFYMALVNNATFMTDWVHPLPLDQFFVINNEMYGTENWCLTDSETFPYWNFVQDEGGAHAFALSDGLLTSALSNSSNDGIMVTLNSLKPIEALLLQDTYSLKSFTYTQLISASLQIIFGHPQPRLQWVVDQVWNSTVGKDPRSNGQTIGVQLRFNKGSWSEPGRLRPNQTFCFLNEIKRLIRAKDMTSPTVYVTGDNKFEIVKYINWLKDDGIAAYRSRDLAPSHIDQLTQNPKFAAKSAEMQWQSVATTFRDWLLLTRVDYLIISRSSFAETASLFSRRPTRRFNHKFVKSCVFDDYGSITDLGMEGF